MFLIPFENAWTITIDAIGRFDWQFWKLKFMKIFILELILQETIVIMDHPLRTLFWIENFHILRKHAKYLHHSFLLSVNQRSFETNNWDIGLWYRFRESGEKFSSKYAAIMNIQKQTAHKRCGSAPKQRPNRPRESVWKLVHWQKTQLVCPTSRFSSIPICLPQNSSLEAFNDAADHRSSEHPGSEKSILTSVRFFFWPGKDKWLRNLTKGCLTCRKSKQTRKDQNTAPNKKREEEVLFPFHTVHTDCKGHLCLMGDGKHLCVIVIDALLRFIQFYLVKSTEPTLTIGGMTTFKTFFGLLKSLFMLEKPLAWVKHSLVLLLSLA